MALVSPVNLSPVIIFLDKLKLFFFFLGTESKGLNSWLNRLFLKETILALQLGEKNGAAEYGKFSSLVSDLPVLPAEKAAASEMPEQRPSGAVPAQRGLQQKIRGSQELRVANSLRLRCLGRFLAANCCSVCNIPHTGNFSGWHLITSSDFIAFLLLYLYRATLISYHAI